MGTSVEEIAERLNEMGVRYRRGPWTPKGVTAAIWTPKGVKAAIYRLRRGHISGVEPLPLLQSLPDRVLALHALGSSPLQMLAQLRSEGVTTRYQTVVSRQAVYDALNRLKLRPPSVNMNQRVREELLDWAASATPAEIATRLNALGLTTMLGSRWTPPTVRARLRALAIPIVRPSRGCRPPTRARRRS
jgi:hypothetical protein